MKLKIRLVINSFFAISSLAVIASCKKDNEVLSSSYGHGLDPDKWPWLHHGAGIYYSLPRIVN